MQEQNNETKAKKDIKVFLKDYKLLIVGLLLSILIYVSFVLGSMYACNGMIYKGVCVQPQPIGTLEICETDPFSCNRNCGTAVINDFSKFCEEWAIQ